MKVTLFAVADNVIIDARSNRHSIINICDEIHSSQFPFATHKLTVIAGLELEQAESPEKNCRLDIACGNDLIMQGSVPVDFAGLSRSRAMVEINAIPVPTNADLHFRFFDGDDCIATWDIDIRQFDAGVVSDNAEAVESATA